MTHEDFEAGAGNGSGSCSSCAHSAPSEPAPASLSSDGLKSADVLHHLPVCVAEDVGINAAALFWYFDWRFHRLKRLSPVRASLNRLTVLFPYLSKNEIRGALEAMTSDFGGKLRGLPWLERVGDSYKPLGQSRFSFCHSFDPAMACKFGILAALVWDNLLYWLAKDAEKDGGSGNGPEGGVPVVFMSPAQWAEKHSYAPLRSVERAFRVLVEAGELQRFDYIQRICKSKAIGYYAHKLPRWSIAFGEGKLDRWFQLHRKKVNKEKMKPVVLADPDLDGPPNSHTSPPNSHRPPPDSHSDRQNHTVWLVQPEVE